MSRGLIAVSMLLLAACGTQEPSANTTNATVAGNESNAATPAPLPGPKLGDVALMQPLRAYGTEPYWGLDFGPGDFRFTDASVENPEAVPFYPVEPVVSGNTAVWTTRNVKGEVVVLTLTLESCLEVGEEDQREPLTAELKVGDRTFRGCAGPRRADAPDEEMDNVTDP